MNPVVVTGEVRVDMSEDDEEQLNAIDYGWFYDVSSTGDQGAFLDFGLRSFGANEQVEPQVLDDCILGDACSGLDFAAEGKEAVLRSPVSAEGKIVLPKVCDFCFVSSKLMFHGLWMNKEYDESPRLLGDSVGSPVARSVDPVIKGAGVFMNNTSPLIAADDIIIGGERINHLSETAVSDSLDGGSGGEGLVGWASGDDIILDFSSTEGGGVDSRMDSDLAWVSGDTQAWPAWMQKSDENTIFTDGEVGTDELSIALCGVLNLDPDIFGDF